MKRDLAENDSLIEQQVLDSANAIRLKICQVYYVVKSIIAVPALISSLSRVGEIGFLPVMGAHIGLCTCIWIITFLRHRIPYTVLSRSIVVINALIGMTGIAQFGLTSAAIGFLVIMGPAAAVFCGRREGIAVLVFVVFSSILVAISFIGGTLTYPMDIEEYLLSPAAWYVAILGWFISSATLTAGLVVFNEGLFATLATSKRQEAELLSNREQLSLALEGSDLGFWDWNPITNDVHFSSKWKTMLGYAEEEISDKVSEWDARVHPDDKDAVYADLEAHLRGETPFYENEHRMLCKDGSYKWILDRGKVMSWTEDGKPLRVAGTHSDVTHRKEVELENRLLTVDLKKALDNVQVLSGLLPICASCKDVRDDNGHWNSIEAYVSKYSEADFSHDVCPECTKKLYPDIKLDND